MSKRMASILVGGALGAMISFSAQAFPVSSAAPGVTNSDLTLVAGGCGIGWHRGPYGNCVPNGAYYPPPVRACPYGYRLDRWGRCIPW